MVYKTRTFVIVAENCIFKLEMKEFEEILYENSCLLKNIEERNWNYEYFIVNFLFINLNMKTKKSRIVD